MNETSFVERVTEEELRVIVWAGALAWAYTHGWALYRESFIDPPGSDREREGWIMFQSKEDTEGIGWCGDYDDGGLPVFNAAALGAILAAAKKSKEAEQRG